MKKHKNLWKLIDKLKHEPHCKCSVDIEDLDCSCVVGEMAKELLKIEGEN